MAILKVARLGHPVLRQLAAPVPLGRIRSAETQRLIDDMIETMREYNGAGLAGNQVHALKQICVIEVHGNPRYPDAEPVPYTELVNPVITALTDELEEGWEGCLSVPNIFADVTRANEIVVQALDRHGKPFELRVDGLLAVCIQHEMDHLIGKLFVDYLSPLKRDLVRKKLEKQRKAAPEAAHA